MTNQVRDAYKSHCFEVLALLARGIMDMDQAYRSESITGYPKTITKPAGLLHVIGRKQGLPIGQAYPLTLDEQISWWELPLREWPYADFETWFDEEEAVLYPGTVSEFTRSIAQNGNDPFLEQETGVFMSLKSMMDNQPEWYTKLRAFLVMHPIIRGPNDLSEIAAFPKAMVEKIYYGLYEKVPSTIRASDGNVYLCPRCGWTLSAGGHGYRCDTNKCDYLAGRRDHPESVRYDSGMMRVKRGIRRYIVDPGLLEMGIYHKLCALPELKEVVLYPDFDRYDHEITFTDGEKWFVDCKDVSNPHLMWEMIKAPAEAGERHTAYLIIPAFRGRAYEQQVRMIGQHFYPDKAYKVMNERRFVRHVKERIKHEG